MPAGRPPKPTHLRLAEGNPGKRPLPKNEPKPKVCLPKAPVYLDGIARAAWVAIGGRLLGMKVMTDADAKALELVCMAYSQFRRAQAVVAKEGMTCEVPVLNKDGEEIGSRIKKRPEVEIAADAWRRVMRGLIEFGLTPSSRTKVQVAGQVAPEDAEEAAAQELLA